jgi:uncharacterized protein YbcI
MRPRMAAGPSVLRDEPTARSSRACRGCSVAPPDPDWADPAPHATVVLAAGPRSPFIRTAVLASLPSTAVRFLGSLRPFRSRAKRGRKRDSQMSSPDRTSPDGRGDRSTSVVAGISDEMVRIYKEQFGRGPDRVRTYWSSDDVVMTILEDTLTPGERSLALLGEHQRLRDTRTFLQYATVRDFCEPIERLTGRKVKAFISGIDTEVDGLAIETFVLHPEGSHAPSRIGTVESPA